MKASSSGAVKLGIIVLTAIVILVIGFNFLKGSSVLSNHFLLIARYNNVQGLAASNPVIINGLQVGTVKNIEPENNFSSITVTLDLNKYISIPKNSIATIVPNPLSNPKIEIFFGNEKAILKNGDTISTQVNKGIVDDVLGRVDPVVEQVKKVTVTLDTLLKNMNSSINNRVKNDIEVSMDNLRLISTSLLQTAESIKKIMDLEHGTVNKSLHHIEHISFNIDNQTNQINNVIRQLDQTTHKLAELDYKNTMNIIDHSMKTLDSAIGKLNSTDGSLGLLLNDPNLYNNLRASSRKLNILLDDIRVHPKRYISFSFFSKKKKKEEALTSPIDDSIHSPLSKP